MEDVLQGLNAAQYEAVTTTEGMVRVIAGAGSGKTRALSRRFAYLVNDIGILPGNILCVTFTNKSANEMRQRIHLLTGDNDTGYINTFHGFCVSVLQEDSYAVQYPKSFLVLDHADIDAAIAIEHLCLAAAEQGLGSCWICNFDTEYCKKAMALPDHVEPIALIALGYANETNIPEKKRKPLSEILF